MSHAQWILVLWILYIHIVNPCVMDMVYTDIELGYGT